MRAVDADTPARFNADPSRLFEASGSAGKVCLFAVRLDTFPKEPSTVFYIGSNVPDDLTAVRRHLLTALPRPPIAGEYIHRTAFDIGEKLQQRHLPAHRPLWHGPRACGLCAQSRWDGFFERLGMRGFVDHAIQAVTRCCPATCPGACASGATCTNTTCWCAYRTTRWMPRAPFWPSTLRLRTGGRLV